MTTTQSTTLRLRRRVLLRRAWELEELRGSRYEPAEYRRRFAALESAAGRLAEALTEAAGQEAHEAGASLAHTNGFLEDAI